MQPRPEDIIKILLERIEQLERRIEELERITKHLKPV